MTSSTTADDRSVAEHLSLAKRDIANGYNSLRSASEHIAAAIKTGATQADAAARIGKSQPWVNRLLLWRSGGFKDGGPFAADHAKEKISRANKSAKPNSKSNKTKSDARARADQAKAEAAEARAEQARAKHAANEARAKARAERERTKAEWAKSFRDTFNGGDNTASIHSSDRNKMVKALGMLGSDHDGEILNAARMVERLRCKLNTTWDLLIVTASDVEERNAA
jgi:hypothetical protein